jgi:hypothetical protein
MTCFAVIFVAEASPDKSAKAMQADIRTRILRMKTSPVEGSMAGIIHSGAFLQD